MLPLIGLAAQFLPSIVGWAFGDSAEKVTTSVVGAAQEIFGTDDVDQINKAIAADPNLALQFKSKLLDIQAQAQHDAHELSMKEIEDKQSARSSFASNRGVLILGMVQVIGYIVVVGAVVWGAFSMLSGSSSLAGKDPGTVAVVASIVSAAVTQLGNMAMQPNSFFYGSSKEAIDGVKQFASSIGKISK